MTTRVRDAATGQRYVCRLIPSQGPDEVAFLLKETYRIQVGWRVGVLVWGEDGLLRRRERDPAGSKTFELTLPSSRQ